MSKKLSIAILGGTGSLGAGVAVRLARAGHDITLGSRDPERARSRSRELTGIAGRGPDIQVASYRDAAARAELVLLTVPYASQKFVVEQAGDALHGKILIDATVPLVPPKVSRVQLPPEGSSAVALQTQLGEAVRVVSAFQNVGAHHLLDHHEQINCDVLVSGDNAEAREVVIGLLQDCGLRGWHAGPLANAAAAEALTSVLIFMNRHYKSDRSGVQITGIGEESGQPEHLK